MYFPYFRGRQYELLALKELAINQLITSSVIPIIEPIKFSPALRNSLTAFVNNKLPIGLILNPSVGDLADETDTADHLMSEFNVGDLIIPAVLLNDNTKMVMGKLVSMGIHEKDTIVALDNGDNLKTYQSLFQAKAPKFTLCPDEGFIRRIVEKPRVLFENRFKKRSRNADYPKMEVFSADHLYYKEDNYSGFSDYSIVGKDYNESGFAPYAVAIHIVYFDENNILNIRHFVSDSNEDISDVAGKFYEAITKLYQWYQEGQEKQLTTGLQILLDHYTNHTYPGLPTLKKLSIMHHLELMGKYLDGGND